MMKNAISPQENNENSIIRRVVDGTIQVSSVEEFEDILKICPTDPTLQRKHADFLMDKSLLDKAVDAFQHTAALFIDNGMYLQAVVAKILQWSIKKPSHEEGRAFHALLQDRGTRHTPLQRFWASMNYTELVTVMLRLVRVHLKAGDQIASVDDPADEIYFVVSGTLAETLSDECIDEANRAGLDAEPILIGANDIFGDVLPLEQSTVVNKDIVAITNAELVKISKGALQDACRKHPNIETILGQIYKPENRETCNRSWQSVRKAVRYSLPTQVAVSSEPSSSQETWQYAGIAVDISLGGACMDMGTEVPINDRYLRRGEHVALKIDLLNDVATLTPNGRIVWLRKHETDEGLATYVGVRFDPLIPTDRELLLEYCEGDIGEQNLLWGLWDSMVRTDNSEQ